MHLLRHTVLEINYDIYDFLVFKKVQSALYYHEQCRQETLTVSLLALRIFRTAQNVEIGVVWGLKVTQVHRQCLHLVIRGLRIL